MTQSWAWHSTRLLRPPIQIPNERCFGARHGYVGWPWTNEQIGLCPKSACGRAHLIRTVMTLPKRLMSRWKSNNRIISKWSPIIGQSFTLTFWAQESSWWWNGHWWMYLLHCLLHISNPSMVHHDVNIVCIYTHPLQNDDVQNVWKETKNTG